ncbi:hypothetical protein LTR10_016844 [Elasticomyces elasticus]|uniref:Steroid 5-alpha reductase C-terminal domain-containing protein n=1 Tax=Exophiala sideris TaxID=1016849 RepID=A0ABR0JK00_9EURO|nr:hypothetical protein LTR10_016844 [Elasticomyces elasticus]KAK5035386.1 hypothetical protein LTS07_002823 [Exophiala sideris]KAK5039263.1 hypothetical protein LTR13_003519 [Exophiala sideris]KAK5066310.1 hypothetical protein LTR69_002829 [Exophiala sideris]KAK5186987.1 hypothetical protein LTR44_000994 [Eurotiomycetes sp. CCFEE 6388]
MSGFQERQAFRAYPSTGSLLGLAQAGLIPSLQLHGALSLLAYGAARVTDRVELKDWLWPSGIVLNTWAAFLAHKAAESPNSTVLDALIRLPWPHKLLLGGVTAWGTRLFYRIATRSAARKEDDPRYTTVKKEEGFWNKALFSLFLPEAIFQSVISLPFTLPFRVGAIQPEGRGAAYQSGPEPQIAEIYRGLAVGLFCTGYALEVLADHQLEEYKRQEDQTGMNKSGVWSIVRHPNYLGDFLVHLAFPFLLLSSSATNQIDPMLTFLAPLANYAFLRYVGGDKENEQSQKDRYNHDAQRGDTAAAVKVREFEDYKQAENSFWPKPDQITNKWTWIAVGCGAAGVLVEQAIRGQLF